MSYRTFNLSKGLIYCDKKVTKGCFSCRSIVVVIAVRVIMVLTTSTSTTSLTTTAKSLK